jgi:DNA-binding XRE family transcriptional regulator
MLNEMSQEVESERTVFAAFAHRFRGLRARLLVKQVTLSHYAGCTEAAISYWESGHRLPKHTTIDRILCAFSACGATRSDLDDLAEAWQRAVMRRAVGVPPRA